MLGRPVTTLRVRSSKYRLHHVRTSVSRFDVVADGSSLRTWRPRVYAKRMAIPIIVHALSNSQHIFLGSSNQVGLDPPADLSDRQPVKSKKP